MATQQPPGSDRRALVLNPVSGDGNHVERVRSLATDHGFAIHETTSGEDIVETAAAVAADSDLVAAAGGDGTLTRAVRGLDRADAFEDTLFGVVPGGTGNNFAANVGVTGIEHAFEVMETGVRRRIDLGTVDGTSFLNSCVAGLTAESSAETESEAKERWGVLAYAMTTIRTVREFDGLRLVLDPVDGETFECEATLVLVGNGRSFPRSGRTQANMEDGLLEVTVVEDGPTLSQLGESVQHWLGAETPHLRTFRTANLEIDIVGETDSVSVDGEITRAGHLSIGVRPETLWLPVGEAYEPNPDTAGGGPD